VPQITTFAEAQELLRPYYDYSRTPYTLNTMRQLMQHIGEPQNKLQVLHVAGTSGKTSTAYYASALLHESGKSVGLSVSPHVDNMNERLQINGQPLPEAEFCAVLGEFLDVIADCAVKPSYFELLAALAYWEFARRGLDYAVMEVGLGGLLDATNVVDRPDKICLITDIGLDHTEILGDTLPQIAAQKAGIIQTNNEVFMYHQDAEIMVVCESVAAEKQAVLHQLNQTDVVSVLDLPLFQQRNLGLAKKAVAFALLRASQQALQESAVQAAARIVVPARLERFAVGDKLVIVDGSHNQQKLHALLGSIHQLYPDKPLAALSAFVKGNDERWQGGLQELLPAVNHIILTSFTGGQDVPKTSVDPQVLATYCEELHYKDYEVQLETAQALSVLLARPEPVLLITGSFYLLNHIRPLLRGRA
jgi:dihydrofolate synthase/folylpolyglutamate synthase